LRPRDAQDAASNTFSPLSEHLPSAAVWEHLLIRWGNVILQIADQGSPHRLRRPSGELSRRPIQPPFSHVREGDTFTVAKLDRLARSVGDLLNIVARLEAKNVSLRVLAMSGAQPLDTGTATGTLMLAVIGAVGQAEREAMLERQRDGIARAKAQGRYKGRVPTVRRQAAEVLRLKQEGVRPSEIAARLGIGRASVYRVLGSNSGANQVAV
jgi:DNA invertase Pin-like site-specific DNA recombinase